MPKSMIGLKLLVNWILGKCENSWSTLALQQIAGVLLGTVLKTVGNLREHAVGDISYLILELDGNLPAAGRPIPTPPTIFILYQ